MGKNILVIGGGASGMMTAISALESGASVTIVEKESRLGKKVLVTGNGRCNLTNMNISSKNYHGSNPLFTNNVLAQFDNKQTINFFNKLGVVTKVEERGRVFPMSDQASSVVDILTHRLKDLGVKLSYGTKVDSLKKDGNEFQITYDNGKSEIFDKVIIAAGGKAMPALGSDGSGYTLAESLGHTITPTWPSLVQLRLQGSLFEEIKGVKIDGSATLIVNGQVTEREPGEILFTHYGVSGPAILKLSRRAKERILSGDKVTLRLTLLNGFDEEKLDKFLADRFNMLHKKALKTSFLGFLQKRLIPHVLKGAGIENIDKKCAEISASERKRIAQTILAWDFEVIDTNSFKDAQVTAGGVSTDEINPKTLESKIVDGLYFCGEVLDIDGDSGGYNLQFAWSSGQVAGKSAAQ
jgi:hypothetical protein